MEFDLHIINNGKRANISIEYDTATKIDDENKEKLKQAINDVIESIINGENIDFVGNDNLVLKNEDIQTKTPKTSLPEFGAIPPKYIGSETNVNDNSQNQNNNLLVKNNFDFLTYVFASQLQYVRNNALQE